MFRTLLLFPLFLHALFDDISYEASFHPNSFRTHPQGAFFQSLYEIYRQEAQLAETYLIPKIIHFIWLGSPLPPECRKWISTWKKLHPGWIVQIWTDETIARFGLKNKEAYERAVNFGEKSDIARYEILYRYGGLYADTDFECLKPLDLLHKSCEFYTGVSGDNDCLLNGLIGSMPGHPILKECIEAVKKGPGDHEESRIMNDTGPYLFTRAFLNKAPASTRGSVAVFPPSFFYPFPGSMRDERSDAEGVKKKIRPT